MEKRHFSTPLSLNSQKSISVPLVCLSDRGSCNREVTDWAVNVHQSSPASGKERHLLRLERTVMLPVLVPRLEDQLTPGEVLTSLAIGAVIHCGRECTDTPIIGQYFQIS